MDILYISLGGALGALTRYAIHFLGSSMIIHHFPFATLIANTLGCFLAGVLSTTGMKIHLSPALTQGLSIGFLGALTTFSTFTSQNIHLIENHHAFWGILNILLNIGVCLLAFIGGRALVGP